MIFLRKAYIKLGVQKVRVGANYASAHGMYIYVNVVLNKKGIIASNISVVLPNVNVGATIFTSGQYYLAISIGCPVLTKSARMSGQYAQPTSIIVQILL